MEPKCYILVLNYNHWADTLELLESLFRLNYNNYRVIVIDNASSDGSVENIRRWAEGLLPPGLPEPSQLRELVWPPIKKPISWRIISRKDINEMASSHEKPPGFSHDSEMVIIQSDENLFYAGGNNLGISYALSGDDFDYLWLLNNDTLVTPNSLRRLIEEMDGNNKPGLCGSTLLFHDQPEIVQAQGGSYNVWLGRSSLIGSFRPVNEMLKKGRVLKRMSYVCGASVLVSKPFLRDIGRLNEVYGMFFEELDWAYRARGKYRLGYAPQSIVYHKEGLTIGSSSNPKKTSRQADFFGVKNRIIFSKIYAPHTLPFVLLGLGLAIINRILRNQPDRVKMILKIIKNEFWPYKKHKIIGI